MQNSSMTKCDKVKDICSLIGDYWSMMIVYNLKAGPVRFNDLQIQMSCASSSTLARKLKSLVDCGFVDRREFSEIPPKVEYNLTERGQKLATVLEKMSEV